jgi:flagellar basal body-associated protein FliL
MLDELLKKPEEYRRKVAIAITAIVGVLIFTVWLITTQQSIKQAIRPTRSNTKTASQQFRESLPSLNEQETITTELMKKSKNLEIK